MANKYLDTIGLGHLVDKIKSKFVPKREGGHAYNNVASAYSKDAPGYWRITLPTVTAYEMLQIEIGVRQHYYVPYYGKIILHAYHNNTSPYDWRQFKATLIGEFNENLQIYGSEGKYFYIAGCAEYSAISVDKILVGDSAIYSDLSNVVIDHVSALPSTKQQATLTRMVTGVKGNNESTYSTGNVNLTADKIGAFEKQPYAEGTLEAGIRPYVDFARANRLAFLPADQIIIEQTTDGGETWTSAEITDATKESLFSEFSTPVNIPLLNNQKSTSCGLRITITGMKYNVPSGTAETEKYNYWNSEYFKSTERYFNVREWWFWLSSTGDRIRPQIFYATGNKPNDWKTCFDKDFRMNGWSGSDWIRAGSGMAFGGYTGQFDQPWNWRLIFWSATKENRDTFISASVQNIQQIRCYGDSVWTAANWLMRHDHLYTWDSQQNVAFPANVRATQFTGALNGTATNASKVNNHTVNSDVPANAVFTDTVTTASTTGTGNAVTAITASNGALTVTKGTTFLTSHQDISGKADKSATVSTVAWDSANKKLTKTINGTTTDVVAGSAILSGLTKSQVTTALGYTPPETDTVATVTTTGSGNAITALTATNGAITATLGATFLTEHQDISGKMNVPVGGNAGQVLTKTATGYEWRDPISLEAYVAGEVVTFEDGVVDTATGGGGGVTVEQVQQMINDAISDITDGDEVSY